MRVKSAFGLWPILFAGLTAGCATYVVEENERHYSPETEDGLMVTAIQFVVDVERRLGPPLGPKDEAVAIASAQSYCKRKGEVLQLADGTGPKGDYYEGKWSLSGLCNPDKNDQ